MASLVGIFLELPKYSFLSYVALTGYESLVRMRKKN
jgi:hypothetical protein